MKENNLIELMKYVYDEYKFDVPLPCIKRHYSEDVEWTFGQKEKTKNCPLIGYFKGHEGMIEFLQMYQDYIKVLKWERKSFELVDENKIKVELDCQYKILKNDFVYNVNETHYHTIVNNQSKVVKIFFNIDNVEDFWRL
jgi:hypothetical protein